MTQPTSQVKPKLLVIGAAGLVGSRTVAYYKEHYDLVLVDLVPGELEGLPVHKLDITDMPSTCEAMRGIDYVVHLAIGREHVLRHIPQDPRHDRVMNVNVLGTQHVFEAARRHGVKRVVFFSSMSIFLGNPPLSHVGADTPVRPANLYACTKLFGEHLAELYAREYDLSIICLRLGQPIPAGKTRTIAALKTRPDLTVLATDYEDIAAAVLLALKDTSPRFALINLFSASEQTRFEHTGAELIGYTPKAYFTPDGIIPNPPSGDKGTGA